MPGMVWGQGRPRRDDAYNRVMDSLFKGQSIPLGGNYNPLIAQALFSSAGTSLTSSQTTIDLTGSADGSLGLIICGITRAGDPAICG